MIPSNAFSCPRCGKPLPMDDVHVAKDMALCRGCGYSGPFLNVSAIPLLTDEGLANPPKRVTLKRDFGDSLSIVCRPKKTALWFLLPFAAIWSGVSVGGIYGMQIVQREFNPMLSLFGVPFLLGTAGLLTSICYLLFGHTTITLSREHVRVFSGLFGMGRVREMPCEKGTVVSIEKSDFRVNDVPQNEIALTSGGRTFKFGAMVLSTEILPYVAAILHRASHGGGQERMK